MSNCGICGKPKSHYIYNNKAVCLKCDELLFDIEIECGEEKKSVVLKPESAEKPPTKSTTKG